MTLRVDGAEHRLAVSPAESLVRTLRDRLGRFAVRSTCGIGVCGSCTVLLDGQPVSACLLLTAMVDGRELVTAEGLAEVAPEPPVQDAFVAERAFQCSFCIPAMTVALHALLRDRPDADEQEVREYLGGNLCRCGTYPQVLAAAAALRRQDGRGEA